MMNLAIRSTIAPLKHSLLHKLSLLVDTLTQSPSLNHNPIPHEQAAKPDFGALSLAPHNSQKSNDFDALAGFAS